MWHITCFNEPSASWNSSAVCTIVLSVLSLLIVDETDFGNSSAGHSSSNVPFKIPSQVKPPDLTRNTDVIINKYREI